MSNDRKHLKKIAPLGGKATSISSIYKEKFLNSYTKTDSEKCWEWNKTISKQGYGIMYMNNRAYRANRLSYFIHFGIDPLNKLVCHHCDNPKCVNPSHLFLGTHKDNAKDMYVKKRNSTKRMSNEFMKSIASSGGTTTFKKYGKNYFSLLAKKMWKKRKNTLNKHNIHHVLKQAIDNGIKYNKTLQNPSENNR